MVTNLCSPDDAPTNALRFMNRLLTLSEVVHLLRVPEATIRRWIRQGELPCTMRQGAPLFHHSTLLAWAETKHIRLNQHLVEKARDPKQGTLAAALRLGSVFYDVEGNDRDEMLKILPFRLGLPPRVQAQLGNSLLEREEQASTALGRGVAVPHPKHPIRPPLPESQVHVYFLAKPLDWSAPDQRPVHTLFLLLSAQSAHHLQLLSALASLLQRDETEIFLQHKPAHDELLAYLQTHAA
jgi:PTS system nitrogen regulatory IIA component